MNSFMVSPFLAMQGPMNTVTQSGSCDFRYRETATIQMEAEGEEVTAE